MWLISFLYVFYITTKRGTGEVKQSDEDLKIWVLSFEDYPQITQINTEGFCLWSLFFVLYSCFKVSGFHSFEFRVSRQGVLFIRCIRHKSWGKSPFRGLGQLNVKERKQYSKGNTNADGVFHHPVSTGEADKANGRWKIL